MTPENIKKASLLIDVQEKFKDMMNAGVGQKITIIAEEIGRASCRERVSSPV